MRHLRCLAGQVLPLSEVELKTIRERNRMYVENVDVTNTGARAGAAVPQVYVASPSGAVPRPPRELKGFTKVVLQPGETRRVTIPLTVRSLAYYDVAGKVWRADQGTYKVLVGNSSEDIALTGSLVLARASTTH